MSSLKAIAFVLVRMFNVNMAALLCRNSSMGNQMRHRQPQMDSHKIFMSEDI
ncbi:hypothetical protein BOA8489_03919 [Boseongicola aestuarii]|uniref:Uncharacterized protein n=1 Tax=Boseongicola aestuarii TaxID=1470561 RepID=A0A238J6K9_9RHOB|nr:hypothetical protein BOA8489_03919 [Boseongicola aestuarii]